MDKSAIVVLPMNCTNLNELVDHAARQFGDNHAVGMALQPPLSYREFHRRVMDLAALLQSRGVAPGDRAALLAENSHNWVTLYLAIVRLGAVAVPILPDLPEADVHHILGEMDCRVIFTTQRQIDKIYDLAVTPPLIVTLDDYIDDSIVLAVQSFTDFLHEAEKLTAGREGCEVPSFPEVGRDDIATILYTSGTSGFSKAVQLTHANLCANGYSASEIINIQPGSTFLSVLPISHTYEFTMGFILPLIKGCRVTYAGKPPTPAVLQKICAREQPHAMLVVPLIMEKIYKKRVLKAIEKSRTLDFICRFKLGQRLIYRRIGMKLLDFFGGRLEIMGIGGAALNPEVENFLHQAGFPYIIGYGQTEAAPLMAAGPQGDRTVAVGSTGKPVPGVELRIFAPDFKTGVGKIEARGTNIMQGYWHDDEATAEVFTADGWLRTGDMGTIDEFGNLRIMGRSNSLIVMANGENIYPEAIEHKLNAYSFVVESVVLENNGVLEALIYPDYEYVDAETSGQSRQQRNQYVDTHLERMRREVNTQLSSTSRLVRVLERREPFIKTATRKIKRYLYAANKNN